MMERSDNNVPEPLDDVPEQPTPTKKHVKSNVAKKDTDFSTLATTVSDVWLSRPNITLVWKTAEDFSEEVEAFTLLLNNKSNTDKDRPRITHDLQQCNDALDEGVAALKRAIDADAKSMQEARATYARFGIVLEHHTYRLPAERNNRLFALKLLLPALVTAGYDKKTSIGTAYFTPLIAQYTTLTGLATNTDKDVSGIIGNKNVQKQNIKKVLIALLRVLEGNYPDTYKNELRAWGFQREKF
ncbi:MAG: hypothetical protein V4538_03260 [Bacteroidota bacterium]